MTLTIFIVFITAVLAGLGFWFYNRRQINSLTETLEDKNAVINSFRDHLTPPAEQTVTFNSQFESVIDGRPEKKKKRYNNRPKKTSTSTETKQQPNQKQKQNSEKNRQNKPRKPKTQQ